MLPYLRQIIRRDCVRNDLSLDIASCLIDRPDMPTVAGKIIVHTTAFPDTDNPFPAKTLLVGNVEWSLKGNYILVRSSSQIPWEPLVHVVHPVNTVIPVLPEPSNLPTVIILMPFLAVGGAERVALDVVRGLRDVVRLIVVGIEPFDPALGTTADAFRQTTPYVYIASDYIAQPLSFSFLQYLIERYTPVTFYVANGSPGIYEALIKVKHFYPKLRIANQVYDHIAGWINRYDTELVADVDVNIGCNRRIGQAYVEHGVSPQKSLVIENGVDVSEFDPALYSVDQVQALKDRFGLPQDKRVITFVSRFHPQKRPMDFVELARRYVNDTSVIFFMVGDGPLASTVDGEIASIGLTNLVRLPFYRPSTDIFAISDVIVLPSEYEGMPMVILEAQAMGKPVVVTDVGNNREVLDVTGGGRVVARVGDITALQAELQYVLNAPPNFQNIRQAIVEHYSLQRMVEKYRRALLEGRLDA
jgi:glycosyltransferase involved in cell wall biosynthesis